MACYCSQLAPLTSAGSLGATSTWAATVKSQAPPLRYWRWRRWIAGSPIARAFFFFFLLLLLPSFVLVVQVDVADSLSIWRRYLCLMERARLHPHRTFRCHHFSWLRRYRRPSRTHINMTAADCLFAGKDWLFFLRSKAMMIIKGFPFHVKIIWSIKDTNGLRKMCAILV